MFAKQVRSRTGTGKGTLTDWILFFYGRGLSLLFHFPRPFFQRASKHRQSNDPFKTRHIDRHRRLLYRAPSPRRAI